MENSKDLKDIPISRIINPGENLCSEMIGYSSEEEEEIMENNPLDKMFPNHKDMSREDIGKEIGKWVEKTLNDPEVIKQNEERQHNALMNIFGIKNEAPSRPPITLCTLQKDFIDIDEKYNSESDESEEENNV